ARPRGRADPRPRRRADARDRRPRLVPDLAAPARAARPSRRAPAAPLAALDLGPVPPLSPDPRRRAGARSLAPAAQRGARIEGLPSISAAVDNQFRWSTRTR